MENREVEGFVGWKRYGEELQSVDKLVEGGILGKHSHGMGEEGN